jgi:hypothetical protein
MTTCDWPGSSEDGTCGRIAAYEVKVDGKTRPLCPYHKNVSMDLNKSGLESEPPVADPEPESRPDPVIDVMPVSESIPPPREPFEHEEPAEVRLKNAVIDLALAGCETLLDRLKSWRKR